MDAVQWCVFIGLLALSHWILSSAVYRGNMRQFEILARLSDIKLIVTGISVGATPEQIGEMFAKVNKTIQETEAFIEIAERESLPWWKKKLRRQKV